MTSEPTPYEMESRRLKFTIAHVGSQIGRDKTRLLLQAWVVALEDDHSDKSTVMDQMHKDFLNGVEQEVPR